MPPAPLIVGVTAHRDVVTAEIPGLERVVRELFQHLREQFSGVPVNALCSLAEGGERIFAREAIAAGVPLIVVLPFRRQLYEQDFSNEASRREFAELCSQAEVLELPLLPGVSEAEIAAAGAARDRQYAQQGVFISQHCQILVAIWDGKPSDSLGGTAQIVRYHHEDEMPGFTDGILDAEQLLAGSENDLVYHVVCSRERPGGEPAHPLQPLQAFWLTTDGVRRDAADLPERYEQIFRRTEDFNRDTERYAGHIRAEPAPALAAQLDAGGPPLQAIDSTFRAADWLAIHFQNRVTGTLRSVYTLAVLMALAFIFYSDIFEHSLAIVAFLVFFGLGLLLALIAEKRAWHRKYLDYRALAEGLRVQFYWELASVSNGERTSFSQDNFLQKQDVELGWIRNVMRATSLRARLEPPADPERGLALAIRDWIGDDAHRGQLAYYARKADERSRAHLRTQRLGRICLWSGIAVAILLAAFRARMEPDARSIMLVLMGVLPLAAGVREAYAKQKADKELIKQYRFMHRIFNNARRRMDAARSPPEKREILRALGNAALDEHAEWILMHRERPLEPKGL